MICCKSLYPCSIFHRFLYVLIISISDKFVFVDIIGIRLSLVLINTIFNLPSVLCVVVVET